MDVNARDVIGPEVRGERISARKGDINVRGGIVVMSTFHELKLLN